MATVIVLDSIEKNLPAIAALGAMHICTNNQAYLMFCECDLQYITKSVTVEDCKLETYCLKIDKSHQRCLKISNIWDKDLDYSGLPIYFSAFEDRLQQHLLVHVYEQLVNIALKTHNMDLCKNITVDLYDTDFTEKRRQLYRDLMGFMVADKGRYFQITIGKLSLQAITANKRTINPEMIYMELNSEDEFYFFDYDSVVTFMNRRSYLEFLCHIKGILGLVAIEKQQPVGYVLAVNNHILQCYANTPEIACDLIRGLSDKMSEGIPVTMFMRECNDWICKELLDKAREIQRIHRFHSRVFPIHVKWENVFLMNIGTHLL
uniref:DUF7596 domain-containing protein n=1 Tax=Setaria digitata TaxID=48799 RepID=A0A915PHS6_9BILA